MNDNKKFPHLIHGVMTLLTAGSWVIIWIIHYFIRSTKSTHIDAVKMKLKFQSFIYMAFGLIFLLVTCDYFSTFSEPGMTFIPLVLSGVVCYLWMIITFISLFWSITAIPSIRKKYPEMVEGTPKFFNNYLLPIMMLSLILISWKIDQYSIEQQGSNLHFTDGFKEAKSNNIFSVEEWNAFKIQKEKEREIANAEKERVEKEEKSRQYIESKINALDSKDSKRLVAENIYKQHGVWIDDYFALQKQECARDYNRLLNANEQSREAVKDWNQVSESLTQAGVSPFADGRSPTTDPGIQRTNADINFARDQLEQCGVRHLDQIENRVTIQ
ncbi:hypothetical protein MUA03_04235 [Enterobacteriaceae bacterium H16N7]|nr:hypothetical protein [Dryocola clanedunensis]